MIFVTRGQAPSILVDPGSSGLQECEQAIAFFAIAANQQQSFKFKSYKAAAVTRLLNMLFADKCAYCESKFVATQPVDVEHYRPKAGKIVGKTVRKPGYYWLAANWDNLLPWCIDCNRERIQEFATGAQPKKTGKGNNFPLVDERERTTQPGEEARERTLLLNPCVDRPEEHLEFTEEGMVRARLDANGQPSQKGEVSIEVYGLQRVGLVRERRARLKFILAQIRLVKLAIEQLNQAPADPNRREFLDAQLTTLNDFIAAEQEYAGMAARLSSRLSNS